MARTDESGAADARPDGPAHSPLLRELVARYLDPDVARAHVAAPRPDDRDVTSPRHRRRDGATLPGDILGEREAWTTS